MSFDSIIYLFFLPSVYAAYLLLRRKQQNLLLLAASYVFYGWWDVRFLFLIIVSTAVDYCCGLMIRENHLSRSGYLAAVVSVVLGFVLFLVVPRVLPSAELAGLDSLSLVLIGIGISLFVLLAPLLAQYVTRFLEDKRSRIYLLISVVTNLGILGFFKYFDFFIDSAETMLIGAGFQNVELLHLDIVLPVGISFYTFQTLSYSIGVYRREVEPTTDYLSFSLFVAFFPQLVAGPIERASSLLPAILNDRTVTREHVSGGLYLILLGLFKKVAIANGLSGSVDAVFGNTAGASGLDVAIATFFFAIQIYCDFSGYSDIARGSARLFGIELMRNFSQPYFSQNPSEFWRRWHISLSSWLRDYLYISLGGNRRGSGRTYRNLMLTMVLGGLWHGAAWNFVLWGFYQGLMLIVHRFATRAFPVFQRQSDLLAQWGYCLIFFVFTCYGWLLFRAESLEQVLQFTSALVFDFSFVSEIKRPTLPSMLGIPLLLLVDLYVHKTEDTRLDRLPPKLCASIYAALLIILLMGLSNNPTQFIYFQF